MGEGATPIIKNPWLETDDWSVISQRSYRSQLSRRSSSKLSSIMVRQLFVYLSIVSLVNIGGISAENFKVPVSPCEGGTTGKLTEVRISDCKSLPCILKKQSTVTIEMDYIPGAPTNRVTTGAYGRLGAVPLPFVGTNGTPACQKIVSSKTRQATGCNQNAGEAYTYTNSFRILAIYPSTAVNVQWELIDGATNQKIACFTVPTKIA